MDWLVGSDWKSVFLPHTPLLEIVVRGTLVYFGIFALLRVVLRRQTAGIAITDLLVIVLVADAAQNAMAGDYKSVPDGLLLVSVIVLWAWALDWLGFRFRAVQRIVKPPKLPLVRDGRLIVANLRRELLTDEELESQLRLQGVRDVSDVRAAFMEPDGRISVETQPGVDQHDPPEPPAAF